MSLDRPTRLLATAALAALAAGAPAKAQDVSTADIDRIRAFYADKTGIKPELATPPRLREE